MRWRQILKSLRKVSQKHLDNKAVMEYNGELIEIDLIVLEDTDKLVAMSVKDIKVESKDSP